MEKDTFDAIARRLGAGPTRRQALRALGGALLAGAVTRLGSSEETEAKQTPGRAPRADRKPRGSQRNEDTRNRKKRRKHRGERRRADQYGCAGGSCVTPGPCPPGERQCANGSCLSADRCCPEVLPPLCDPCEEPVCEQGAWSCRSACQFEGAECCQGMCLTPCRGEQQRHPQNCQCVCPTGEELLADQETCCPYEEACFFDENGQATICCADGTICVGGDLCT